jgi:hypothetical protein
MKVIKTTAFALLACALLPVSALADTDMVNEDWVLSAGEVHGVSFTLSSQVPVHIGMTPVRNADKGVTLRVVPAEDVDACSGRSQGACRSRGGFDGFKIRSFSHTEAIPAGRWTFYVANTENIFKSATVHVRLVVNPSN